VTQLLAKAGPVDTGGLAALGVSHVLVARDQPGAEPPLRGARTVYSGPTLTLYELRERPRAEADSERVITAGIGHGIGLLTLLVVLGYFATTGGIPVLLCGNSQEEG
jgi:hypothetical protein